LSSLLRVDTTPLPETHRSLLLESSNSTSQIFAGPIAPSNVLMHVQNNSLTQPTPLSYTDPTYYSMSFLPPSGESWPFEASGVSDPSFDYSLLWPGQLEPFGPPQQLNTSVEDADPVPVSHFSGTGGVPPSWDIRHQSQAGQFWWDVSEIGEMEWTVFLKCVGAQYYAPRRSFCTF
jgi:hypothetical protein